jgi:hypothetical protein
VSVWIGIFLSLVWPAILLLVPLPLWAHGGIGIEQDTCVERAGPSLIHFVAYQPELSPSQEFCTRLPQVGSTILVFDLIDEVVRKRPASLRVVEAGTTAEPRTLLHIPAQTYLNGVLNAELTFDAPGRYAAIVTLENPYQQITFPFRVGRWSVQLLVALGGLVLGALGGYFFFVGKKKPPQLRLLKG